VLYLLLFSALVMHVMGRPLPTRWQFYYSSTQALNIAFSPTSLHTT